MSRKYLLRKDLSLRSLFHFRQAHRATRSTSSESRAVMQSVFFLVFFCCSRVGETLSHFSARRFWCPYFHAVVQSGPPGHSIHVLEISRCNSECFFPGVFWCSRAGEARWSLLEASLLELAIPRCSAEWRCTCIFATFVVFGSQNLVL